jgi:hypothetical protein
MSGLGSAKKWQRKQFARMLRWHALNVKNEITLPKKTDETILVAWSS